MSYRNGNYTSFYVDESSPFNETNLGANSQRDFVYYNTLKMWKGADDNFPFINSHEKTYSVRDGSDWENTLKPRIRERLNNSKNIILFLSSITKSSKALREEIDFGVNNCGLPIIIIYPEFKNKTDISSANCLNPEIKKLWDKLPILRDSISKIPTLHIVLNKEMVTSALKDQDFMLLTKTPNNNSYYYT